MCPAPGERWGSSCLPDQAAQEKNHRNGGRAETIRIKIGLRKDQKIGDQEDIRNGESNEAEAAPEQQPLPHHGIRAQQQNGANECRKETQDVKQGAHQSRSFFRRKARANSSTEEDVFECIMVEIRTRSRRYAASSNRINSSCSGERAK